MDLGALVAHLLVGLQRGLGRALLGDAGVLDGLWVLARWSRYTLPISGGASVMQAFAALRSLAMRAFSMVWIPVRWSRTTLPISIAIVAVLGASTFSFAQ